MIIRRLTILLVALCAAEPALAARPLLSELLGRAPVTAGGMSAPALEACVIRARELESAGFALDNDVSAMDRLAAEDRLLKNQINAEIGAVNGYDEAGIKGFQERVIRQGETSKKFEVAFAHYRQSQMAYDAALTHFDRDCARPFTAADLIAVKTKLGIK
jgi:predicted amidohydrolase YtcJ